MVATSVPGARAASATQFFLQTVGLTAVRTLPPSLLWAGSGCRLTAAHPWSSTENTAFSLVSDENVVYALL